MIARSVRVQAHAPAGSAVALAITAAEIHAAPLHVDTLAATMRRAFVLHADRALCLVRSPAGVCGSMTRGSPGRVSAGTR